MRFVDRQGRVDRFMQKMNVAQQKQAAKSSAKKAAPPVDPEIAEELASGETLSYKQILQKEQNKLKNMAKNRVPEQVKAA